MIEFKDADAVVDGKKIRDWAKSDEGLVDYSKSEFRRNVSNTKEFLIYDLGAYEYDPSVGETRYYNGLDLARVAAVAKFDEKYDGMSGYWALEGDDYVRLFYDAFEEPTIQEFLLYFFRMMPVDIYISEINYRVYLKVRECTKEEWDAMVQALFAKERNKNG